MEENEKQLIEYFDSYAKLLNISAEYMKNLGELEEKNKDKFKEIMNDPAKLIELASKNSKKLSQIFVELIGIIATISIDKNPMELPPSEKKRTCKKTFGSITQDPRIIKRA